MYLYTDCDYHLLRWSYRKHQLLAELKHHTPDVGYHTLDVGYYTPDVHYHTPDVGHYTLYTNHTLRKLFDGNKYVRIWCFEKIIYIVAIMLKLKLGPDLYMSISYIIKVLILR